MSIVLFENKEDCCGCWGCYNACPRTAIEMIEDKEGFKYPIINNDICIECGLCQKVCPIKNRQIKNTEYKSKNHIGIINLQNTQNYGAVIAASVLASVVQNIVGSEYIVKTIDYKPKHRFNNRFKQLKDNAKDMGGYKLYFKSYLPDKFAIPEALIKKRKQNFSVFRDTFINSTETVDDAYKINDLCNFNAFIVGSDIVWAPKRIDNFRADGYCLKFARDDQRKIAYAPSLDSSVNKKLIKLQKCYRDGLKHFDRVSVREKSNLEFVQNLTDKKVYECCDPVFLVPADYYDEMINIANVSDDSQKYIYVYILEINQEIVDYANKLAKEKGLKICYYSKYHNDYIENSENCISDGPAEFLYRLKNAEYVLTNSFHCIVFSLLFEKQFLSFARSKISIKSTDLLDKFGLLERIITKDNKISIDKGIDFKMVYSVIDEMRNNSIEYLSSALKVV